MKAHAIRFHQIGGPEVLRWEEVEVGDPGAGEVLLRQTAVGLNFIDTYHRSGLYPMPLPSGLGSEASGVIVKVGKGVKGLKKGQRVAYCGGPIGAYADARLFPADRLVPLPRAISDKAAAAMMLKGMTVEYLLNRTYPCRKGEIVLFHAAAGGVGLIACQWAKAMGVQLIGTVGNEEKAKLARDHGAKWVIDTSKDNVVERVKEITKGLGVPVVYDSIGKDTWESSLACLKPRGLMVSFGNASGPVAPFSPAVLSAKGSLFLTRPTLFHYTATREDLLRSAKALFGMVQKGKVKIEINQTYALKDAAQAHRDLVGRKTTGSTVLLP
ncbi:MAG: quinone oxidoreductase [Alphaproteobacteria bacterium]|nr:quinone oxidoreductase [Alphaproteobacteria bacterium]